MKVLFQLIAVIVFCAVGSKGLECYSCNTKADGPKCGDDFRLISIDTVGCEGSCIKRRGHRDEGGATVVEISRGCVADARDGCSSINYNGMTDVDACICNTDACNTAAARFSLPWWTLLLTLILCICNVIVLT